MRCCCCCCTAAAAAARAAARLRHAATVQVIYLSDIWPGASLRLSISLCYRCPPGLPPTAFCLVQSAAVLRFGRLGCHGYLRFLSSPPVNWSLGVGGSLVVCFVLSWPCFVVDSPAYCFFSSSLSSPRACVAQAQRRRRHHRPANPRLSATAVMVADDAMQLPRRASCRRRPG